MIFFSKERNVRHNVKIQVVSEKIYMVKIKAKSDVNFCHVCQTNNFRPLYCACHYQQEFFTIIYTGTRASFIDLSIFLSVSCRSNSSGILLMMMSNDIRNTMARRIFKIAGDVWKKWNSVTTFSEIDLDLNSISVVVISISKKVLKKS